MEGVKLSRYAVNDLNEIDFQTIQIFGIDQADKLEESFAKAFRLLGENPQIGRERIELSPLGCNYRYWQVLGRFLLVYKPTEDGVIIFRILNTSRQLRKIFTDAPL